ncbi:MAG: prepilin-type N-terminal cleavage/methylation domain-containing protein [Cyanothece sp. SIO2G6]|nr:prepilin-type N-terminal cleavage/methylation domain-containing protein [Cyanothece sp. SIO2G6]
MQKHSQTDWIGKNGLWLRYLLHCHNHPGFTLIELLVTIVVIGILSAIALPSVISRAQKAKEAEARMYVASVNKGQQVYYLEYSRFSSSMNSLGVGIPSVTKHYRYQTQEGNDAGSGGLVALTEASQLNVELRPFSGQVWTGVGGNDALTTSIFCEGNVGGVPPEIVNHQCP